MHDTRRPPAVQTFTCQGCGAGFHRPPTRGQRPKWCPDCRGKHINPCRNCGQPKPMFRGAKNCDACWTAIKRARIEKKLPMAYAGPAHRETAVIHVKSTRLFTAGTCRVCQSTFISPHLDVTCSADCADTYRREQRRIHKARRAARKRGAYVADVSPRKVFEADGYRCHICRRKTDPTKQVPHPKAPTIDHVIPIAIGGTHEPLNCRTACFRCNCTKNHLGHGDQLMLIAI